MPAREERLFSEFPLIVQLERQSYRRLCIQHIDGALFFTISLENKTNNNNNLFVRFTIVVRKGELSFVFVFFPELHELRAQKREAGREPFSCAKVVPQLLDHVTAFRFRDWCVELTSSFALPLSLCQFGPSSLVT